MKIVVVNNLYPPLVRGGAEKYSETLVAALESLGHEVFVISTKPYFSKVASSEHLFYLSSLYYHLSSIPKALRLIWHWFNLADAKAAKKLLAIKAASGCDLVITNNLQGLGLSIGQTAQAAGIKWAHIIHDVQLLHPSGLMNYGREEELTSGVAKRYQAMVKKNLGTPDLVISPSNWILELHRKHGFFEQSLATTLPHPYAATQYPAKVSSEFCHFVYVGQIEDHKGIILLLDAFREFCKRSKFKAQLSIAGDGRLLDLIKINYQNLPINFLGRLNSEQVATLLSQAACLVVPSLCYENWPTVIIEAALAGLPVIASDLGGNQELIHNHDYLFVPNLESLTNKLIWVATNREVLTPPVLPSLLSASDYAAKVLSLL